MDIVIKILLALLGASLFGFILLQQRADLQVSRTRADKAEQALLQQQVQLRALESTVQANQQLFTTLQKKHRQIQTTLTQREEHLEQLIQHNATLRAWGETPLPDAIIQLRQQPTTTYRVELEPVPAGNAMPTNNLITEDQPGVSQDLGTNRSSLGKLCCAD